MFKYKTQPTRLKFRRGFSRSATERKDIRVGLQVRRTEEQLDDTV